MSKLVCAICDENKYTICYFQCKMCNLATCLKCYSRDDYIGANSNPAEKYPKFSDVLKLCALCANPIFTKVFMTCKECYGNICLVCSKNVINECPICDPNTSKAKIDTITIKMSDILNKLNLINKKIDKM